MTNIINNEGTNVCRSCFTVNGYKAANEYIDFHENKYKIMKKINLSKKISFGKRHK